VPYCVTFGTMLAEGRGERLTQLDDLPDCSVVICKPRFSIRTPELFRELDEKGIDSHPSTKDALKALAAGDLRKIAAKMENVFEQVLGNRKKAICSIKKKLSESGALGAVMSGTGSAVFGLYEDSEMARSAAEKLRKRYAEVFLCRTIKCLDI
jgi:4-diphosphocytidyl-2-C-methyl-D-erythritol kinase